MGALTYLLSIFKRHNFVFSGHRTQWKRLAIFLICTKSTPWAWILHYLHIFYLLHHTSSHLSLLFPVSIFCHVRVSWKISKVENNFRPHLLVWFQRPKKIIILVFIYVGVVACCAGPVTAYMRLNTEIAISYAEEGNPIQLDKIAYIGAPMYVSTVWEKRAVVLKHKVKM